MDEEKLKQEARLGKVLSELRNTNGWVEFVNILVEIYDEASEKLDETENIDARYTKKIIRELAERFDIKIKTGEEAKLQLKQMFGTS